MVIVEKKGLAKTDMEEKKLDYTKYTKHTQLKKCVKSVLRKKYVIYSASQNWPKTFPAPMNTHPGCARKRM